MSRQSLIVLALGGALVALGMILVWNNQAQIQAVDLNSSPSTISGDHLRPIAYPTNSPNAKFRAASIAAFLKTREKAEAVLNGKPSDVELIEVLRTKYNDPIGPDDLRISAAKELGKRRAASAIPSLVDLMMVVRPQAGNALNVLETHPLADVLMDMGTPALPYLSTRFIETADDRERYIIIMVIRRVGGRAWAISFLNSDEVREVENISPDIKRILLDLASSEE